MPVKIHQFTVQAKLKSDHDSTNEASSTNSPARKESVSFTKEEILDLCMEQITEKLERHLQIKLD